jgi:hypothetical protein
MYSLLVLAALTPGQIPITAGSGTGCNGSTSYYAPQYLPPQSVRRQDVVLRWNEVTLDAIRADRTPPPLASRNLATVHTAIYDALNAIYQTHHAYYVRAVARDATSPEATAAIAAHRTLISLYPKQTERFDAALDASLDAVAEGEAKQRGIELGQYVAEKILAWRDRDGARYQARYQPGAGVGVWQPTPPDFAPPLLPQWPEVTCFAMRRGPQFRPKGPPALTSADYAASFNEVKALGGVNSTARTPEQTEIAWFWADGDATSTPPGHWNLVAQELARARGTTLPENARLFALLNVALADAGISCWDCKYHFGFWRPIQGIRRAAEVANKDTTADPNWTPLLVTPPFPTYTSGHSTFSGAGARLLADFFGTDRIRFSTGSDGLRGVRRSYDSLWQAAEEAGKSRIYGGIHWEFDNADGLAGGRAVADYVFQNFMTPLRQPTAGRPAPFQTAERMKP